MPCSDEISEISENISDKVKLAFNNLSYIGRPLLKKAARFPINTWNVHHRILNELPATNNPVESRCSYSIWYLHKNSFFNRVIQYHPTLGYLIGEIRLKKIRTEAELVKLQSGKVHAIEEKKDKKERRLKITTMVSSYNTCPSILSYMESMPLNIGVIS